MYSANALIRVLKKDLGSELRAIKFYIDNLEKLNYKNNKKSIDTLLLDSIRHSEMITKRILALENKSECRLTKKMVKRALTEESALRELYAFQLMRTEYPDVLKVFNTLLHEESRHKDIVRSLK